MWSVVMGARVYVVILQARTNMVIGTYPPTRLETLCLMYLVLMSIIPDLDKLTFKAIV